MGKVIQTEELTKRFKNDTAVNGLNLNVEQGDIYGFIGQNGAGKTTTIRLLLGLLAPSKGSIELFGEKMTNANIHRFLPKIGAIIETPGFYLNLTGYENLDIHRIMMKMNDKESINRVLKTVHLEDIGKKKVKDYSLGMKQRLGIARCLLHDPKLLLLDEPTNGLDPGGIIEIRDLIIDIAKTQGKTIIISSHILDEVEKMVNKIGIINKGRLLVENQKDELIKNCTKSLIYKVDNIDRAMTILKEKNLCPAGIMPEENRFCVEAENDSWNSCITKALVEGNVNVYESKIVVPTLEKYFLDLIQKEEN